VEASRTTPQVKSAARTIELLEYLAANRGLHNLNDVHSALNYPKSSLYVLLRTLVDLGWIETDVSGTLYRIGLRPLLVGTSYLDSDPIVSAAHPVLDQLAAQLNETVHLARLDGSDVVYMSSRDAQHHLRPLSRIGRRLPAYSTSLGKALLAERSDVDVLALLPPTLEQLTPTTVSTWEALLEELRRTRERGHSWDNGENTEGLRCVGVAVRSQTPAIYALSCSVPKARMTASKTIEIADSLKAARDRIEDTTRGFFRA
jgi:IclR family transcriptional regulator, acetate operon repressor